MKIGGPEPVGIEEAGGMEIGAPEPGGKPLGGRTDGAKMSDGARVGVTFGALEKTGAGGAEEGGVTFGALEGTGSGRTEEGDLVVGGSVGGVTGMDMPISKKKSSLNLQDNIRCELAQGSTKTRNTQHYSLSIFGFVLLGFDNFHRVAHNAEAPKLQVLMSCHSGGICHGYYRGKDARRRLHDSTSF